jgi:hypothetical protein
MREIPRGRLIEFHEDVYLRVKGNPLHSFARSLLLTKCFFGKRDSKPIDARPSESETR